MFYYGSPAEPLSKLHPRAKSFYDSRAKLQQFVSQLPYESNSVRGRVQWKRAANRELEVVNFAGLIRLNIINVEGRTDLFTILDQLSRILSWA